MRTVLMVLFDQVQSLDVTGPLEVFTGANTWQGRHGDGPAYDIRTASLGGRPVRTSSGLRVTPDEDLREFRLPRPGLLLSPRHFARAFAAEVGMPPGRYVDRVRLETARRRLEDTADGVEQTARSCGYGTPEAMRRAFARALGVSPGEYRRRFRPAVIHD
jgi:transcriptional regulator GlxA family with amidase domain